MNSITNLLLILLVTISFGCKKELDQGQPVKLSKIIIGSWANTEVRGWPYGEEWHTYDPVLLRYTFSQDDEFSYYRINASDKTERVGTYEINDATNQLTYQIGKGSTTVSISEYDESSFIMEVPTDEGLYEKKFEKVE